jgi:hypothetical protein
VKEDIMDTRYSPSWETTTIKAAGELAGCSYFATLLLALLGENNLSQQFSAFRQL